MSKNASPLARASKVQQRHLDVRLFVLASLAAALGYVLLPVDPQFSAAIPAMTMFRGLLAGCVAGLLVVSPNPRWTAPAAAALGIAIGTAVIARVAPGGLSTAPLLVGLALGIGTAILLSWLVSSNMTVVAETLAVLAVLVVMLWCVGWLPGAIRNGAGFGVRQTELSVAPQPEGYAFDGNAFLRTYYLMKGGEGYYAAFLQGLDDDLRYGQGTGPLVLGSPFNYREPFVFYLWRVLPGASGAALFSWFVVYSALVLVCSYVLASSLAARGVALLAPIALVAWFYYFFWAAFVFLLPEVWAAGFGLAAIMCLMRRWRIPSLVLLATAVAAREFMVLLIPAWLLVWWFAGNRKANWWFPAAAILGPVFVLGAFFLTVPATFAGGGGLGAWMHGGASNLIAMLRFGSANLPAGKWLSLAIAAMAIAGAAMARPSVEEGGPPCRDLPAHALLARVRQRRLLLGRLLHSARGFDRAQCHWKARASGGCCVTYSRIAGSHLGRSTANASPQDARASVGFDSHATIRTAPAPSHLLRGHVPWRAAGDAPEPSGCSKIVHYGPPETDEASANAPRASLRADRLVYRSQIRPE